MKKLALNLDALTVVSFDTADAARELGTVEGHMATPGHSCLRTACCPDTYQATCTTCTA